MMIRHYPYYFKKCKEKFLVVNLVGEHIFLSPKDFENFITERYENISEYAKIKLYSRCFISDIKEQGLVEDLLAVKLRSRKAFLNYFTSLHMVVLTLRCNCCCDYCHASSKDLSSNETDMSLETAKSVLDMILQSPSSDIKIEFQGGEPSLNWPVLRYFVLEGEKRIRKTPTRHLSFVICTNLFDISDEQFEFLQAHHICISTSCDGPKHFYDLHRKARDSTSAFDKFMSGLQRARSMKKNEDINALLTVTKDNLPFLIDVVNFYVRLGFHSVFIRALNPYGYAKKNKADLNYSMESFVEQYSKALLYIIELNKKGIFFIESYASLLFQRIMTPFSTGFVDLQSPAGAGISGAIYYYNGDVYPADEARMLATMGNYSFKMGNVFNNTYMEIFYGDIVKKLVLNSCVESMPGCSTCPYSPYCGADPIRYYAESKDILGKRYDSSFCKKNKGIIDILFKIIEENDPDTMAVLWSWIFHRPVEEWQCGKAKE